MNGLSSGIYAFFWKVRGCYSDLGRDLGNEG